MSDRCEVAILGAGPAASATALTLVRNGVADVRIVGSPQRGRRAIGETLLPDTAVLLNRLGLGKEFLDEGHESCLGSCSSWGSSVLGHNDFILSVHGHGWHLDRERFDAFLLGQAETTGATVMRGTRFAGFEPDKGGEGGRLRLTHPHAEASWLRARFVVDATGTQALFARAHGARRLHHDRLVFVYGFFDATAASSALRMTMVEATRTGWWYAAGLPQGLVAVALAADPVYLRQERLADANRWLSRLLRTQHIAPRLDGCRLLPRLAVRVAPSALTQPVRGTHWLAVGDAASSYDPLSGQGIRKALSNGIDAGQAVADSLQANLGRAKMYATSVAQEFRAYCAERDGFYASETRWSSEPFWAQRRHHALA